MTENGGKNVAYLLKSKVNNKNRALCITSGVGAQVSSGSAYKC